jgi:hypothetical protein
LVIRIEVEPRLDLNARKRRMEEDEVEARKEAR